MILFTKPFDEFSFNDVVEFCQERHIEGLQLDYKKELPSKGLAKHFAAFSNTRGGIILIGVDEDKQGFPINFEGLVLDGKIVDKIHQYASNVEPRPSYDIRVTDENDGKVFILVKIYEGDRTPYYVQNDANLYIRTGNITDPIDIASPDAVELLFGKRDKAQKARANSLKFAESIYKAAVIRAERERAEESAKFGRNEYFPEKLNGGDACMCLIVIQPFNPVKAITTPKDIKVKYPNWKFNGPYGYSFPSRTPESIPEGVLGTSWDSTSVTCEQVFANGLLYLVDNILDIDTQRQTRIVSIDKIVLNLFSFLKAAANFYRSFGYQGGLIGFLEIKNLYDVSIQPIYLSQRISVRSNRLKALMTDYNWDFETDTAQLFNEIAYQSFFIELMERVHWNLGLADASFNQTEGFLRQLGVWVDSQ
jgi:hypothetical protein